jgi:phosphate transport system substrate-binding protein
MKPWAFAAATAVAMTMTSTAKALDLPSYQPMNGIAGERKSVGSDTLGTEMEGWAKGFMALYPTVKIEVVAKGSATAPPALLQGVS